MKSQLRLGLRLVGKHHWKVGMEPQEWRCRVREHMRKAFEMNCMPKHSDEGLESIGYTMDYVTGVTTWHAPPIYTPRAFVDYQLAEGN